MKKPVRPMIEVIRDDESRSSESDDISNVSLLIKSGESSVSQQPDGPKESAAVLDPALVRSVSILNIAASHVGDQKQSGSVELRIGQPVVGVGRESNAGRPLLFP